MPLIRHLRTFARTPALRALSCAGALGLAAAGTASGQPPGTGMSDFSPWRLCGAHLRQDQALGPADMQEMELAADRAALLGGTRYRLEGNAVLLRAGQRLTAERATYDKAAGVLDLEGGVQLDDPGMRIMGSRAHLELDTDRGYLLDARYYLFDRHGQGRATAAYQEGPGLRRFEQATYTTCDPGREHWRISAGEVLLDEVSGRGVAKHATLRLGKVPVLYLPYMTFPIDDRRKTGFLTPRLGRSQRLGIDAAIPFYWNIAPDYDATFTPRVLTERGFQLGAELRWLGRRHRETLNMEVLPSDRGRDGATRWIVDLNHVGAFAPRWSTRLQFREVSDPTYFEDFGNSLSITSLTHLERIAEVAYRAPTWSLRGRVQNFQTVDVTVPDSSRPYERLPQFLLRWTPHARPFGLRFDLDGELVRFDHVSKVRGIRLDLKPRLTWEYRRPGYYLNPVLSLRDTRYQLDNPADGQPDAPARTLPIVSLDGGLFFERNWWWQGAGLLQTLEPRAFYLFVPETRQDDLPVFDSGRLDFNFARMFQDNRFSSADRQGDANQLTLAVTSRLLRPATGVQHAHASLGTILYFRDRVVSLPGQPVETTSTSNLVGDLGLQLTRALSLSAGLQWDPHRTLTERASARVQYRPDRNHILNLAYRFRDGRVNQIDASGLWYLTPRWHVVGRYLYAFDDARLLEGLAGLEYESCCWTFRVLGRSFVTNTVGDREDAVLFQLELKGLTSVGNSIDRILETGILGYARDR